MPESTPIPTPKISVLIPAYNEEAGLPATLNALVAEESLRDVEIIVIDDGSSDRTAEVAGQFQRVRVIRHPFNRGYGSAIRTGLRASYGEYICWFDADGQHQASDLVTLCKKLVDGNLEYCIGVRDEKSYQDPNRQLGKWLLKLSVNFSVGQNVPDFNSGLRGFRREVLTRYAELLPKGFGASTLTTLLMIEGSHYGDVVPITVKERVGKSSVKQFRDGMRTLQIILHIVVLFKPLKFFGVIGLSLITLGMVYGLVKASINQLGFPVFGLLLIMLGVQAFLFGFIGDQISAMRRERLN